MKLEHKKQNVLPLNQFLLRMARYFALVLGMIGLSVLAGVVGYHHYSNLNWMDSLHMACLILTGMGPVVEMTTDAAKLFDSIYALYSGVAFLSFTAVLFTPIIHRLLHILHFDAEE